MEGGTNLDRRQLHKRAVDLRERYETAFESYVDCGVTYLRIDALTRHCFAKTHDAETDLLYETRQRCEIAFRDSDPDDDQGLETVDNELSENDGSGPVRILGLFALQAWHCANVGAAIKKDFPHVSTLLDNAVEGMTRLENELSRLKVDVQAFEAMAISNKDDTSTETAPAGLDELNIRTWYEAVTKLATAKCPRERENVLRHEDVLGYKYPAAGQGLSMAEEKLGIVCEFKDGDDADATVV